jgi:hypothetical protein
MIDNPEPDGFSIGRRGRILLTVGSLAVLGGFAVAYRLEPDPRGFGTHQRLGLPPCTIRAVFGVPCPSCGMTTSFANITKGRWRAAARANFAGLLLSGICAVFVPWSWLSVFYGRLCWIHHPIKIAAFILVAVSGVATVEWMIRLFMLYSTPSAW